MCKIFWLFVNTLTADDKYSLPNTEHLLQHLQIQLSQKQKSFLYLFCILEIYNQFWIFSKKRWSWWLMYFWSYELRKTSLDKCLKSSVWDDPLTSNIVNGLKHSWNRNASTFTIFIGHCEDNSVPKSHSCWHAKDSYCLLTHWLLMTCILVLVETIYCLIFRCNYLRNKNAFLDFSLHLRNLVSILNIFQKRWRS